MATYTVHFVNQNPFPVTVTLARAGVVVNTVPAPILANSFGDADVQDGTHDLTIIGNGHNVTWPGVNIRGPVVFFINRNLGIENRREEFTSNFSVQALGNQTKTCEVINDKEEAASVRFNIDGDLGGFPRVPILGLGPSEKLSVHLNAGTEHTFTVELGRNAARVTIRGPGEYAKLYLSSIFPHSVPGYVKFVTETPNNKREERRERKVEARRVEEEIALDSYV